MKAFIPEKKLSKKAKKELAKAKRTVWERSPVTMRVESKKHYNRKRTAREPFEGLPGGKFVLAVFPRLLHYLISFDDLISGLTRCFDFSPV